MWPRPRWGTGKSLKCHNLVFPEDSGGKYMQTLLQNDLVSAVRGTGEEARLGGQGSGDGWAEGWKGGVA